MDNTSLLIPKQMDSTRTLGGSGVSQLIRDSKVFKGDAIEHQTKSGETVNVFRSDAIPKTLGKADNFDQHLDADDAYFLRHELEFMLNREITTEYPEKKARSSFPINSQGGWAHELSYTAYDRVGRAKIVTCANDWPRVALGGVCKWTSRVVTVGSGFELCYEDIMAARFANKPLESRLMGAVREAMEEEFNRLVWYGDSAAGLLGLANNPYIPRQVSAVPFDSTSDPQEIVAALHTAANFAIVATLGAGTPPDTMLLPLSVWTYLASTQFDPGNSSNQTILQRFLADNMFIRNVDWIPELETFGSAGGRAIFFYHNDPRSIDVREPVGFTALPAFWNGLSTEINFLLRFGGLWLYYPARAMILEGI